MQEAGHRDILVNRLPMYSDAAANQVPVGSLPRRRVGEPREPHQAPEDNAPIGQRDRSASLETDTSTASASVLSVKVPMPFLQENWAFSATIARMSVISFARKPLTSGDQNRINPELRIPSGVGDVNVGLFAPLHAEEKKPIPPDSEKSGHFPSLPPQTGDATVATISTLRTASCQLGGAGGS